MPIARTLVALALAAAVAAAAEPQPVLRTLDGKSTPCEVVNLTATEVIVKADGKQKTVPVEQVLQLDFRAATRPKTDAKYTDVELADGSLLHCTQVTFRGKQVEAVLVSGQKLKFPLDAVGYVLHDAQDTAVAKQWKEVLGRKRSSDLLASLRDGQLITFNGTFGDADAEGKTIQFDLDSKGEPRTLKLEKAHALAFYRQPDPKAPPVLCKLTDTAADLVMVGGFRAGETGYTVTTPAGATLEYPKTLLVRLDYSKGKLTYLSDLEPVKVVYSSTEDAPQPYRRDKNLDNRPLMLTTSSDKPLPWGKGPCPKGLAVHAYTSLEYDLGGDYREFSAYVGVDHDVGGSDGGTRVVIEGDGKVLYEKTIFPRDDPDHARFGVKDVKRLRIIVSSADLLDLGRHVDLADAKVSK
jgi:hypothetical protein